MFATLRQKLKWAPITISDNKENKKSHFLLLFAGLLEEVLFWKTLWLSLSFITLLQVIFLVCVQRQISLLQFILCLSITILIMDAFETWLKYKHRTTFLKRISNVESKNLNVAVVKLKQWMKRRWIDFVFIRETNHTKAFLMVNIVFGTIFFLGKYINGYLIIYFLCMFVCVSYKLAPPVVRLFKNVIQEIESDTELEGLMPEASDIDIKLLNIEPERNPLIDDRQSLGENDVEWSDDTTIGSQYYWKPDDVPIEEASDSSENSSSLVTNFSMEKVDTLHKDVETSDNDSSEDEYIPLVQQKEQLQSTLEVADPSGTWGSSAYNAFWNITGAVANMVQPTKDSRRKRISSADSSDGFEIIDRNELN